MFIVDGAFKTEVLKMLSFLLGYPEGESFWAGVLQIQKQLDAWPTSSTKKWLQETLAKWQQANRQELRLEYVQTFDFRETTCLYLTAHEFGDSRERGNALLELHGWFRVTGYDVDTSELPDYLPLLFEWLAMKPKDIRAEEVEQRIALVCHRILEHLGPDSSYTTLFCAALTLLPDVQYENETSAFPKRQLADDEPMPYPLNAD